MSNKQQLFSCWKWFLFIKIIQFSKINYLCSRHSIFILYCASSAKSGILLNLLRIQYLSKVRNHVKLIAYLPRKEVPNLKRQFCKILLLISFFANYKIVISDLNNCNVQNKAFFKVFCSSNTQPFPLHRSTHFPRSGLILITTDRSQSFAVCFCLFIFKYGFT